MTELTNAEEAVMQRLWGRERAFVKDLVADFSDPKPAYNTVSSIIRILEKKEFVAHKVFGHTHEYYPLVSKEEYTTYSTNMLVNNYFEGSLEKLISFWVKQNDPDAKELSDLIKKIRKELHDNRKK